MFVLPTGTRPGVEQPLHRGRRPVAGSVSAGQAAVVGTPATSMLSLTANGTPASAPSAAAQRGDLVAGQAAMNAGW